MMTFIHTADWQLRKPFAGVDDADKRSLFQQPRLNAIDRIGAAGRDHRAAFVLVAGDLFDSPRVTTATVSAAFAKIGSLKFTDYETVGPCVQSRTSADLRHVAGPPRIGI